MSESLGTFELQLLWEGVEDFTGLWDAETLAQRHGETPGAAARGCARLALERLARSGLVEIYSCRGVPFEETCAQVGLENLSQLLEMDDSWKTPDEGEIGVWYDTTDEGFALYKRKTGWGDS